MKPRYMVCLLLIVSVPAQASSWADWWATPDQQAQRALDAGDAPHAAQLFNDPRRRAYAELKAGQYADAAQRLASFSDAESQYNRGNALARAGDLQNALTAYDAALKQVADNSALQRDAQHNRDLVAKQLQQQQQQSNKNNADKNKSEQNRSSLDKSDQVKSGQGKSDQDKSNQDKSSQAKSDQGQSNQQQSQANSSQQTKQGSDKNSASQASGNNKQTQPSQQQANKSQQTSQQSASSQSTLSQSTQSSANASTEAQQAQRDALAAKQMQQSAAVSVSSASAGQQRMMNAMGATKPDADKDKFNEDKRMAADSLKPPSEQAIALEQWLRQIPDDPSGLLRRKFLIEHMMKQKGEQP